MDVSSSREGMDAPHRQTTLAGSDIPTLPDGQPSGDETVGAPGPATLHMLGREILGQYRVLSKLGQGGMGSVYLAEQIGMQRRVAIKVLHVSDDADAVRRFAVEARAVARLDSPHIVSVYNYGQLETGEFYIAMELLQGRTLGADLSAQGRFPLGRVIELVEQAAHGLDEAHRHSVIHRDLKPGNIMLVSRQGSDWVKLLDFGIAKVDAGDSTRTRGWMGTPQYMAPEQFTGHSVDARTDVYALALITYEMLCGRTPFLSDNPMSYVHDHVYSAVPRFAQFGATTVPPAVEAVVLQGLSKAPGARPASASAFASALSEAAAAPSAPVRARGGVGPIIAASVLGVAVLCGGAGLAYTVLRAEPEPAESPMSQTPQTPQTAAASDAAHGLAVGAGGLDPAYVAQLPENVRDLVALDEDALLERLEDSLSVYPPSMRGQVLGQHMLQLASMPGPQQATARKVVLINTLVAMDASSKYLPKDSRSTETLVEDYLTRPGPIPRATRQQILDDMRESVPQVEDRDWTIRQWLIQLDLHEKKQNESR